QQVEPINLFGKASNADAILGNKLPGPLQSPTNPRTPEHDSDILDTGDGIKAGDVSEEPDDFDAWGQEVDPGSLNEVDQSCEPTQVQVVHAVAITKKDKLESLFDVSTRADP
ncbi:hypothetical protein C0991_004259, partial [Blastosporella zonata]